MEESGYNKNGPNFGKNLPKSSYEFQKQCDVAKQIEDCLLKNNLKEICGEDPKYKQLSGSILYMCEHPHKDGMINMLTRRGGGKGRGGEGEGWLFLLPLPLIT